MNLFSILIIIAICHISSTTSDYKDSNHSSDSSSSDDCSQQKNISIPDTYTYTAGIGYHKHYLNIKKTWNKAREFCQSEGAHLAIIDSRVEERLLLHMRKHQGQTWLGFHDLFEHEKWVTVLDKPSTYFHWSPGNPDNPSTEFCGSLEKYGLNNLNCDTEIDFICEINI